MSEGEGWPYPLSRVAIKDVWTVVTLDVGDMQLEYYPRLFSLTSCAIIFGG